MAPITDRRLTVDQCAQRASVHPETIRRAIRREELKATRNRLAPGGPLLVAESDFRAWVAERTS